MKSWALTNWNLNLMLQQTFLLVRNYLLTKGFLGSGVMETLLKLRIGETQRDSTKSLTCQFERGLNTDISMMI